MTKISLLTQIGIYALNAISIAGLNFGIGVFLYSVLYTLFDILIMPIMDNLWLKFENAIENTSNTYEKAEILDKQYQKWPHKYGKVKFKTQTNKQLSGNTNYGLFNLIQAGQIGTISYKTLQNGRIFITGFVKNP